MDRVKRLPTALRAYSFLLLAAGLLGGCISAKFTPNTDEKNIQAGGPRYAGRSIYTLTCLAEQKDKRDAIKLPYAIEKYAFSLVPACDYDKEVVKNVNQTKPVNMVVVLDRSGSMQASIDAVKGGILEFSRNLESFGWDVHFAAIGFRDAFHDFHIANFGDAVALRAAVGSWVAQEGGDPQEGGQKAIRHGYAMLSEYNKRRADRAGALNVILYVSNGVAYWEDERNYFAVDRLVALAKGWKAADPSLRFYFSVDAAVDPARDQGLANAPAPHAQMSQFLRESGLTGKSVGFPLSREILTEFSKEFQRVTTATPLICYAQSASLVSTSVSGEGGREQQTGIFDFVSQGEPLTFKGAGGGNDYTLIVERCCKRSAFDKACALTEERSFPVSFNKKD